MARIWIGLAVAAGLLAGGVTISFWRDLAAANARLAGQSETFQTQFGTMEYASRGTGPTLLMIHGTGGGFDQALLFAQAIRAKGHRIIAPSRFGYLRSTYPDEPSAENQADALAVLLDHLGIGKIVVAGGSAGAIPAAVFAIRHPDRCAGVVLLVPASNLSGKDPVEMTSWQKAMVQRLAASDFAYWSALKIVPRQLTKTLLATDPELLDRAEASEKQRAEDILSAILPISHRTRGMLNDGRMAGAPVTFDYAGLAVPTLIISVEDDRFGTAATARAIAQRVKGSQLVIYPSGGHIWLGHDEDVAEHISAFIARHPGDAAAD